MASSPKAPDPYKQMQASNNANMWSAFTNSVMGNANTVGPYGSTTSKVTGYIPYKDPTTGQTYQIPQFTQTTTPSADQARLLGQETNLKSGMMSSAANQLGTYSKLGAVDPSKFHAWGTYEKGPELVTPDEAYRKEIQDKMMASYTRGVTPQQQAEDAQLAARGQSPGGQMDYTMAVGGAFGAGGSAVGDLLGTAINAFKSKPKYPTDEALFAAAESTPKNIKEGKTLATKAEKVKDLRISATKGQEGLKELSQKQLEANAAAKGYKQKEPYSYEEVLNTSKLAHEPAGTSAGLLAKAAGRLVDAGGMPMAWLTGGKTRAAGTALEMAGNALNSKAAQKKIEDLAASIRNAGVANVPPLSPQDISVMRDYLAKTAGRVGGTSR